MTIRVSREERIFEKISLFVNSVMSIGFIGLGYILFLYYQKLLQVISSQTMNYSMVMIATIVPLILVMFFYRKSLIMAGTIIKLTKPIAKKFEVNLKYFDYYWSGILVYPVVRLLYNIVWIATVYTLGSIGIKYPIFAIFTLLTGYLLYRIVLRVSCNNAEIRHMIYIIMKNTNIVKNTEYEDKIVIYNIAVGAWLYENHSRIEYDIFHRINMKNKSVDRTLRMILHKIDCKDISVYEMIFNDVFKPSSK